MSFNIKNYLVSSPKNFKLKACKTNDDANLNRQMTEEVLMPENTLVMRELQERLYAENKQALLIVFQAMDAAGKDGAINHVMSGLNPQGCRVESFKQPSAEEIDHDYLWRIHKAAPRRGEIGIFNRSHYEEVIVTRVHNLVASAPLPQKLINGNIWKNRYRQIRDYERYLTENGVQVIKFFLHLSKEEQRERLLARLEEPDKSWKFSVGDVHERNHWDKYQEYYEDMIQETSRPHAPWFVIPADKKWFARYVISAVIRAKLEEMDPQYPEASLEITKNIETLKKLLAKEQ